MFVARASVGYTAQVNDHARCDSARGNPAPAARPQGGPFGMRLDPHAGRATAVRSKIRGDTLDLPVAVADGVKGATALRLLRLVRRRTVALGAPGGSLGQRPLGRG